MSPSRRDFVRTAGVAAATVAVGGAMACNGGTEEPPATSELGAAPPQPPPLELEAETLNRLRIAILNGHWPENQNITHMFAGGDVEHRDFLKKLFGPGNPGNIDDLLENKVMIADQPQRAAVRGLGVRINEAFALGIYDFINTDVDELRDDCGAESHWY